MGVARSTVAMTIERGCAAGLGWPLPATLSDAVLEAMLYAGAGAPQGSRRKTEPDWTHVHRELRRPGVTLMLLWEEYRQAEPGGYGYSRWCELYRAWEGRLSPTMRQAHPAGERLFVDYAGQTIDVVDGSTGEIRPVQIFVAVLGASSYTYAEATWTQTLPDWIGSHVRALAFFGGVPAQLVPDNLEGGRRSRELVRARAQSDLSRPGAALRHGDPAGTPAQAARQGQGRGRRARGGALDPGAAAEPAVLLAGRAERRRSPSCSRRSTRGRCGVSA